MDSLDQAKNVGSHYEEVAEASEACVPIGVRRAAGDEHGGTGAGVNFVFARLHAKSAFQHVPGFIVFMVAVARGNQARRSGGSALVLPFGDDERIVW